jgi:superfamily II DNA/RNA helicase
VEEYGIVDREVRQGGAAWLLGLDVDDGGLVVHAYPPAEYQAHLYRSGRTARAGATGAVFTLMTCDQVDGVRHLARQAGVAPTTTRFRPGHPLLGQIAPARS